MRPGKSYISFFRIIGNFDVENILKFQRKNKVVIVTTKKTYPKILNKLNENNIPLIITDNFKPIKKLIKKSTKFKYIHSEIISDRSIHQDID